MTNQLRSQGRIPRAEQSHRQWSGQDILELECYMTSLLESADRCRSYCSRYSTSMDCCTRFH